MLTRQLLDRGDARFNEFLTARVDLERVEVIGEGSTGLFERNQRLIHQRNGGAQLRVEIRNRTQRGDSAADKGMGIVAFALVQEAQRSLCGLGEAAAVRESL